MDSVIAGFLVKLGFTFDKDQLTKFEGTVSKVGKGMMNLAKMGVGAGVAITAAIAKANAEVNKLYTLSNNTGASVHSIRVLGNAFKSVGGSAEDLQSAVSNLAHNIKYMNYEPYLKGLGVSLRDANGEARDTSDVLLDLREVLLSMPQEQARPLAESLGLGGIFEPMMKRDFPDELQRSKDLFGEMNQIIGNASESSHVFSNEFGRLMDVLSTGSMAIGSSLVELLDLDDMMKQITTDAAEASTGFIKWQRDIIKNSDGFGDWVRETFVNPLSEAYMSFMNTHIGLDEIRSGAMSVVRFLTPDELEGQKATKQSTKTETFRKVSNTDNVEESNQTFRKVSNTDNVEESNQTFRKVSNTDNVSEINRKNRRVETIEDAKEVHDRRLLRTRGMRNNNPGNLRAGQGQIGTDSSGYAVFPTREAGYNAAARQLKGYANAGLDNIASIVTKWAPHSENDTYSYINSVVQNMNDKGFDVDALTQLDLSNSKVLKALLDSMINHEVGAGAENYFKDSTYEKIVQMQSQNHWRSQVVREADKRPSVTVNQNITINGVQDPQRIKREIDPASTVQNAIGNLQ